MYRNKCVQRALDCAIEYADINRKLAETKGNNTVIDRIMPHHMRCYNALINALVEVDNLLIGKIMYIDQGSRAAQGINEVEG
jgi:hypothetical protein